MPRNADNTMRSVIAIVIPGEIVLVEGERGEIEVCSTRRFSHRDMPEELLTALQDRGWNDHQVGVWWSYADGTRLYYAPLELRAPAARKEKVDEWMDVYSR